MVPTGGPYQEGFACFQNLSGSLDNAFRQSRFNHQVHLIPEILALQWALGIQKIHNAMPSLGRFLGDHLGQTTVSQKQKIHTLKNK
jgi:hypothetical protein